ncbi:cell wall hydrolase [Pseudomonas sp. H11T01]|uniref:cell wall hydrolase n=1 Tax=Pseudomonas sp. H11T01 TaxID=3402749 RepID=UPI003AC31E73
MTVTDRDPDILVRTLWGEARGEGLAGRIAVGWTIRNRVNDGKAKSWWGEGYAGVCLKVWQFSCWNKNDPNFRCLSGAKPIPAGQFAHPRARGAHCAGGGAGACAVRRWSWSYSFRSAALGDFRTAPHCS